MLENLIDNAVKYSQHKVEVHLSARTGPKGQVVIEVRDRGRGVPAGEWERIFDGFYRASNAGEVRPPGARKSDSIARPVICLKHSPGRRSSSQY